MWRLATLASISLTAALLGQGIADPGDLWGRLLTNALGSSPIAIALAWRLYQEDKENGTLREENAKLHERARQEVAQLHERAVHSAERLAPLLVESTKILDRMGDGLQATLSRERARSPDDPDMARRIEALVAALERRQDGS